MKRHLLVSVALLMLVSHLAMAADSPAAQAFERMKALAGEWRGTMSDGKPISMSLAVTSGSSVLMQTDHTNDMMTMFHLNGDRLMLTHYCDMGDQPRMVSKVSPDGKTISFDFLDITNLPSPDTPYMRRLVVVITDSDHFSEQWFAHTKQGKEVGDTFTLTRKGK